MILFSVRLLALMLQVSDFYCGEPQWRHSWEERLWCRWTQDEDVIYLCGVLRFRIIINESSFRLSKQTKCISPLSPCQLVWVRTTEAKPLIFQSWFPSRLWAWIRSLSNTYFTLALCPQKVKSNTEKTAFGEKGRWVKERKTWWYTEQQYVWNFCLSQILFVYYVTNLKDTEHTVLHFTGGITLSHVQKSGPQN